MLPQREVWIRQTPTWPEGPPKGSLSLRQEIPPDVHQTMRLAQTISATPTSNFGEPAIAVSFALARPGETVDDFQKRINGRGGWGQ